MAIPPRIWPRAWHRRIERDLVSPSVDTLASLVGLMGEALELTATQVESGHDATLFDATLALTPEERIEAQASWSRGMREIQRAAGH